MLVIYDQLDDVSVTYALINLLYLPPSLKPIGVARWWKAEFDYMSLSGGFLTLVDLLRGRGSGVEEGVEGGGCGVGMGSIGV